MSKKTKLAVLGFLVGFLCMRIGRYAVMADYVFYMRPATIRILNFQNPYVGDMYYPPWTFLPFLPLALLPVWFARGLLFFAGASSFLFACYKLKFGTAQTIFFMLSPPVVYCLAQGNIDWLVLWGLWLPFPWGVPFFLAKPQMGWGVVAAQLFHRESHEVWRILFVSTIICSALVVGIMKGADWNVAIEPRFVAVVGALICLYLARKQFYPLALAATASVLISPYLTLGSYSMVLLLWAVDHKWVLPIATMAGWSVLILEVVT